jgi:PUA domain protein
MKAMKNKEVKELIRLIKDKYGIELSRKDKFETQDNVVLVNHQPFFFYYEKTLIPTLKFLLENPILKKITVDMGAVKFVVNGADIMRPGIIHIEEGIEKDSPVVIVDETHKKPLAIGIALFSSSDMQSLTSGKVIRTLHWVGDSIWGL